MSLNQKQVRNNQRLAARYAKLNAGKSMTLDQLQAGFKDFCKSIIQKKSKTK